MKLLVTGGAGFIGSNFIRYALHEHPRWTITNLDKLTYDGNLDNLRGIPGEPRYRFIRGDIADWALVEELLGHGFDAVINFAAESHVDQSIMNPLPFITTNVVGTQVLLEGVRKYRISRFIQISTDEVYGSIENGCFDEQSPLSPSNPYAASKTSAELFCLAQTSGTGYMCWTTAGHWT